MSAKQSEDFVKDFNVINPEKLKIAFVNIIINAIGAMNENKSPQLLVHLGVKNGNPVIRIEDNGKGGWYAYRASKSALNMLLKTSAIEYQRTLPELRFIAFHPGTTDTPLSKPFQRSVPEGKLFTPDFVASSLLARLSDALVANKTAASFVAWDGSQIPW